MFSLVKFIFCLGLLGAAVYGVFFADVGGKPVASHVGEVWGSDLVQKKIDSMKRDMREDLEDRLAKAKAEKAEKADKSEKADKADTKTLVKHDGRDALSDADRESLSALIEKKTRK